MKIVKASNGKDTVKMSKSEWQQIGKTAGWMTKKAMVEIPCGTFSLRVLKGNEGRQAGMGNQLVFNFKGKTFDVVDAQDLSLLMQQLDEYFKEEIAKSQQSEPFTGTGIPAKDTPSVS